MAARQHTEHVRGALRLLPGSGEAAARIICLPDRDDLLADENAEQADERHQRRRRRAHVEEAVDDADQKTGAERYPDKFS